MSVSGHQLKLWDGPLQAEERCLVLELACLALLVLESTCLHVIPHEALAEHILKQDRSLSPATPP
jgi:hypothetical protein